MLKDLITKQNYSLLCFSNKDYIKGEIKGVATAFHGYCSFETHSEPKILEAELADRGILTVYPYYGPWAWANKTAMETIDRLIELTYEINCLDYDKVPLVINGKSMGGMTALAYTHYTKFKVAGCAADCPVTDLVKLIEMRPEIYRAMITAFAHYSCSLEEAMKSVSPIEFINEMPYIPYYIVQGDSDCEVECHTHSMTYVPMLRKAGRDVTFRLVHDMQHCEMPENEFGLFCDFIEKCIAENRK